MVGRERAGNSLPGIHEGLDAGVRQATRARARLRPCFSCKKGFRASATGWRTKFSGAQGSHRERVRERSAKEELDAVWRATRFVARAALRTIGRDYSDPPKDWLLHVRWREGGKCPRDRSPLRRARIGGRTTVWCPLCQR